MTLNRVVAMLLAIIMLFSSMTNGGELVFASSEDDNVVEAVEVTPSVTPTVTPKEPPLNNKALEEEQLTVEKSTKEEARKEESSKGQSAKEDEERLDLSESVELVGPTKPIKEQPKDEVAADSESNQVV